MKNYELIAELMKYPAGADISLECVCDTNEVTIQEDSDDGEVYIISRDISCVDMNEDENIVLS